MAIFLHRPVVASGMAPFSVQTSQCKNEARLFCNLIRSYVSFLLVEHVRLTRSN